VSLDSSLGSGRSPISRDFRSDDNEISGGMPFIYIGSEGLQTKSRSYGGGVGYNKFPFGPDFLAGHIMDKAYRKPALFKAISSLLSTALFVPPRTCPTSLRFYMTL